MGRERAGNEGVRAAEQTSSSVGGAWDGAFLLLIVAISAVPYIGGLGFYSDDWSFLAPMHLSPDRSPAALFDAICGSGVRMRPLQCALFVGLYSTFALEPLGYHLVNTAVLAAGVVLFHVVLRELGQPRHVALAVPLVYALLPHYSTDRFWMSSFQAAWSMTLYFFSVFAALRAARSRGSSAWSWWVASAAAVVGSTLFYEVFVGLVPLTPLLVWYRARRTAGVDAGRWSAWRPAAASLGVTLLALLPTLYFKRRTTTRMGELDMTQHAEWFRDLLRGAAGLSFGDYGVRLPLVLRATLRGAPGWPTVAVGAIIGALIFGYLWRVMRREQPPRPTLAAPIAYAVIGVAVLALGYAVFLTNEVAQNTAAGISNRIAIAGAVGVALAFVGAAGMAAWLARAWHRPVFCAAVALLGASGCVVVDGIATYWVIAYEREREVLATIEHRFPALPPGTTMIVDGVCPYVGPAIVFDSSWDLVSALRVRYGTWALDAHPVTPNLTVEEDGLVSSLYGRAIVVRYPFERLIVHDVARNLTVALRDAESARRYFARTGADGGSGCPPGREGVGVPIF